MAYMAPRSSDDECWHLCCLETSLLRQLLRDDPVLAVVNVVEEGSRDGVVSLIQHEGTCCVLNVMVHCCVLTQSQHVAFEIVPRLRFCQRQLSLLSSATNSSSSQHTTRSQWSCLSNGHRPVLGPLPKPVMSVGIAKVWGAHNAYS